MKKRYLILAGLLVMTVAAAGCGKKKTTETAPVEVTATPTPEVTKAVDMVDMQQTADEDIKNVMGEKTSTASKIVFVNNTGDDIQSLYIRTHVDEDSEDYDADEDGGWGDDLINGMFTLTDKDKALYYMQTANTQTSGTQTSGTQTSGTQTSDTQTTSNKSTASYDIRIAYTDEDTNECFFRDIPLGTISQITLCMDGTDDDAIPYAKYLTGTSTKEVSTLDAVKERLGSLNQIPQTTVIRILQMILIPQIVTTVLIRIITVAMEPGIVQMIRAMGETQTIRVLMMIRAVTMIREMAAI